MIQDDLAPQHRKLVSSYTLVDRIFRRVITTGGLFSLVVLGLIGAFLLYRGFEIFSDFGF